MIAIRYLQLSRNTTPMQVALPWALCKSCVRCECSFASAFCGPQKQKHSRCALLGETSRTLSRLHANLVAQSSYSEF